MHSLEKVVYIMYGQHIRKPQHKHMQPSESTLYDILQLPPSASSDDIRASYKRLVLQLHPDRHQNSGNTAAFQALQHAYTILQDDIARTEYDRQLALQAEASMVAVSDELELDDMDVSDEGVHTTTCRCGGHFVLPGKDLELGLARILLPCDTCSLLIAVQVASHDT